MMCSKENHPGFQIQRMNSQIPSLVTPVSSFFCITSCQAGTTCGESSQADMIQIFVLIVHMLRFFRQKQLFKGALQKQDRNLSNDALG